MHVPYSTYPIDSIYIKSNTHLHFADSVSILGSMELEDYPEQHTRVAGIEMIWPQASINIQDTQNVKISGYAITNDRGRVFWNTLIICALNT